MKQLKELNIWAYCKKTDKSLKAPAVGLAKGTQCLRYDDAKLKAVNMTAGSPYFGMVFLPDNTEYFGIDVDIKPDGEPDSRYTSSVPQEVTQLLIKYPTHVHVSPNGYGLHIIYKISPKMAEIFDELDLKQKAVSVEKGNAFSGDIRYRSSFLVFTETKHLKDAGVISVIPDKVLTDLLPSVFGVSKPTKFTKRTKVEKTVPAIFTKVHAFATFLNTMDTLPSTFTKKVENACEQLPFSTPASNYEYWVLVGNACAAYEIQLEMCNKKKEAKEVFPIFHTWSEKDEKGYKGEEDVATKYKSLYQATKIKMESEEKVSTLGSLLSILKFLSIDYPDKIKVGKLYVPDSKSIRNIDLLLKTEGLEFCFDPMGNGYCFKGEEAVVSKWFCPIRDYTGFRPKGYSQLLSEKAVGVYFLAYLQDKFKHSVNITAARVAVEYLVSQAKAANIFRLWIQSREWDGVPRFRKVCMSIKYDMHGLPETEVQKYSQLFTQYIRRSLLAMVGIHYWPEDRPKIDAMLVLRGFENTYKTTWAESLIPKHMGSYTASPSYLAVDGGNKDWAALLSTKSVIVINECERLFTPAKEADLKSSIDQETVTYREPYATTSHTRKCVSLMIGTTNKTELFTGDSGSRKIWQIPVKQCDTYLLRTITAEYGGDGMQQVYAEILHILKGFKERNPHRLVQAVWNMKPEQRSFINHYNAEVKGKDIGILGMLVELFGDPTKRSFVKTFYLTERRGVDVRKYNGYSLENAPNFWTPLTMVQLLKHQYPDDRIDRKEVTYALKSYSTMYTDTATKYFDLTGRGLIISAGHYSRGNQKLYLMPKLKEYAGSTEIETVEGEENEFTQ